MAESTADTTQTQESTTAETPQGETQPAETPQSGEGEVFSKAQVEAMIKDRLDRAARKAEEAQRKAAEEAQRKAAEEQGKYQELYEQTQAELAQMRQDAAAAQQAAARRLVAQQLNLPDVLAERLRGETEEELLADAESLLGSIKPLRPPAPNINAASGDGRTPASTPDALGGLSPREFAARYNLTERAVNEFVNRQQ